jgi:hypothetical protein
MTEFQTPAWFREWFATQVKHSSNYSGLGISAGGICARIARLNGAEPWGWFFIGFTIAPGLLAFLYSTDFMVERRLIQLKRWRDEERITQKLYEMSLNAEMEWRASRLYGIAAKPPARSRRKSKPKSSPTPTSPASEEAAQAPVEPG